MESFLVPSSLIFGLLTPLGVPLMIAFVKFVGLGCQHVHLLIAEHDARNG